MYMCVGLSFSGYPFRGWFKVEPKGKLEGSPISRHPYISMMVTSTWQRQRHNK